MCQVKIRGHQHHREQQDDRVVVDRAISALRRHHPGRNHQNRAEQSGRRSIQRQNPDLPAADQHVRDPEDHRRDEFLLKMIHTRR